MAKFKREPQCSYYSQKSFGGGFMFIYLDAVQSYIHIIPIDYQDIKIYKILIFLRCLTRMKLSNQKGPSY